MNKNTGLAPVVWLIIAAILLGGGYAVAKNAKLKVQSGETQSQTAVPSDWKTYRNEKYGFEFQYPSLLSVRQDGEAVVLNHSIAYKHSNPCDFKGNSPPLEKLSDFNVSFTVVNKNLKDFIQSSAFPGWDYVSKNPFKLGSLNGFRIMAGIEGCGKDVYYFTISPTRTLIIDRRLITEFNPIIADYQTYLNLPGILTPDKNEEFFTQILSTFKFTK